MKVYEGYKPINLPWLQYVPSHWDIVRNKVVMNESKTTVGDESSKYTLLSLTKGGVIIRDLTQMKGKFPSDFGTYKTVTDGQIIFCLFDVDETPRTVGLSQYSGMITGAYDVFDVSGINPDYLQYYYISLDDVKAMRSLYTGLRKVIGITTFLQLNLPLPPRDEQDQIVCYLDWKVSQISKLIIAKKKQISLLQEQKQVVINQAVTKGLDPDVEMKDSGIDWLGEVPIHWAIERIGQHFSIRKNIAGQEGYSVFSITQQGLKVKDISVNEGQMATNYEKYQFVRPGDFAMNHMDLLTGFVGIASHLGVTSPDYRVFELLDETVCLPEYFLSTFQLCYYRKIFYGFGRGAATKGRWRMPKSAFLNFFIPIPSIEEQKKIAEFISISNSQIEQCIRSFEHQITLLHEYRTRLISDVVTGKLDVRDVAIPDYEAVEEAADAADIETEETEGEDDAD